MYVALVFSVEAILGANILRMIWSKLSGYHKGVTMALRPLEKFRDKLEFFRRDRLRDFQSNLVCNVELLLSGLESFRVIWR